MTDVHLRPERLGGVNAEEPDEVDMTVFIESSDRWRCKGGEEREQDERGEEVRTCRRPLPATLGLYERPKVELNIAQSRVSSRGINSCVLWLRYRAADESVSYAERDFLPIH